VPAITATTAVLLTGAELPDHASAAVRHFACAAVPAITATGVLLLTAASLPAFGGSDLPDASSAVPAEPTAGTVPDTSPRVPDTAGHLSDAQRVARLPDADLSKREHPVPHRCCLSDRVGRLPSESRERG
jgi:hypothetical protein